MNICKTSSEDLMLSVSLNTPDIGEENGIIIFGE